MRCQRCQFENMPGQTKCFKCGSILDGKNLTIDVHPPRMAPWKKPFRDIKRFFRRWMSLPVRTQVKSSKSHSEDYKCLFELFLSIIPGLAHLVNHRFREIRWYFIAWLFVLSTGLFLYGTNIGFCLIGLAVGLHTWIAFQHSLLKRVHQFGERLGSILLILITIAIIYHYVPRLILPNLTGGYTSLNIPYQNIQQGDYLLAWRDEVTDHPFPRGSLVLARLNSVGRAWSRSSNNSMIVQIVGLPGELIQINDDIFIIDDQVLDIERYPVPQWLHGRKFSCTIPNNSYFVSSEYLSYTQGRGRILDTNIRTVCLVTFENIQAKAFMRWLPLSRRGFLEEAQ